jgi:hypothetical protein
MYCKYLKLTNGEDILVTTDDDCQTFIDKEFIPVVDPVLITTFKYPHGEMVVERFIMQPWIRMAREDLIHIPTKSIVLAVDVKDSTFEQYIEYVDECANLEPLLEEKVALDPNELDQDPNKDPNDDDTDEEYYDPRPTKPTRTIH